MEKQSLKLVELLANWRKRLQEAAKNGEDLDELLLQAEQDLQAAGFPYAIPLLRREVMRLKLIGPILGVEYPKTPATPFKPIEPIETPSPPAVGPVPLPSRITPQLPTVLPPARDKTAKTQPELE
ncbi:MAG: hypothetical protein QXK45_06685 [Thermofilaceae archaeon]